MYINSIGMPKAATRFVDADIDEVLEQDVQNFEGEPEQIIYLVIGVQLSEPDEDEHDISLREQFELNGNIGS